MENYKMTLKWNGKTFSANYDTKETAKAFARKMANLLLGGETEKVNYSVVCFETGAEVLSGFVRV